MDRPTEEPMDWRKDKTTDTSSHESARTGLKRREQKRTDSTDVKRQRGEWQEKMEEVKSIKSVMYINEGSWIRET